MDSQNNKRLDIKHKFIVKELSFVNKEKSDSNFKFTPIFSKKITRIDDLRYDVSIKCQILDSTDSPFPFDITVIIGLISFFENGINLSEDELNEYLNITCVQILFPYLRSAVTSLTSAGLVSPLILPIIDVKYFGDNKELQKKGGDSNGY